MIGSFWGPGLEQMAYPGRVTTAAFLRLAQERRTAPTCGENIMLGLEPARQFGAMPECDRLVVQWTRLIIGVLMLAALIAGLLV